MPVTLTVVPLTLVTWPVARMNEPAPGKRRAAPEGKLEPVPPPAPPSAPRGRKVPPPGKPPPAKPPPVPEGPPARNPPVHEPVELAACTVMVRAAMVVLDVLDGVPLTVTQSPEASELTASDTVLENVVVLVQFTVVCPVLAF